MKAKNKFYKINLRIRYIVITYLSIAGPSIEYSGNNN